MSLAENFSSKDNSGIDELVKLYLQSKGYTKALEALEEEISPRNSMEVDEEGHLTLSSSLNGQNTSVDGIHSIDKLLLNSAEAFCFLGIKNGDITTYQKEYDILYSWMCQSLDATKSYLQAICFVLFVYWYPSLLPFVFPFFCFLPSSTVFLSVLCDFLSSLSSFLVILE
jgi:hypothetical protein